MFFKKLWMALTIVALSAALAHADLDGYLKELDIRARADFGDFKAQVGAHFGVPAPDLDLVFKGVLTPADAVICLWLGQQSGRPYDVVMREYRARKGQGWGALAQSLGIKPGSPQFKALKAGELGWKPGPAGGGSVRGKERHDGHHDDDHRHDDRGGQAKDRGKGQGKNK